MLQTIRERFTGVVALLVIGAIGLTLVISFGNMDAGVATGSFAARVNGEEIPVQEFQRAWQTELLRQQERIQGELPAELQTQIQRTVLDRMVANRLVAQYARDEGYRVDNQRVAAMIRSVPNFQVGGEFSRDSYIAVLASQGLTPDEFERDQRLQLEISQLQNGLLASSFLTPTEYRRFIELQLEQRTVQYVELDPTAFTRDVQIAEEDVQSYYEQNPDQFETAENLTLQYVEIRLDEIGKTIDVDDAALREFYDANPDQYRTREERYARHILIAGDDAPDAGGTADRIAEIEQKLAAGEDFGELAREFSDDAGSAKDGGDLGWTGRGDFVEPFEDVLFEMEKGAISEPVTTRFGVHFIQMVDLRPGTQQPFDAVKDELREELTKLEAEERFYTLAEQVDDLALENSSSLDIVAQETGLELKRASDFSRAGGAPFGFSQALIDAAFSPAVLDDGENSPLIEIADDNAVVIRVVEHRRPELRPLETVRDGIEERLKIEKAVTRVQTTGEAILSRLEAGGSLQTVAKEFGLEVITPEPLRRNANAVAPELLTAIFRAPAPPQGEGRARGVAMGNGGYAVFRLTDVRSGQPDDIPRDERDRGKATIAGQLGGIDAAAVIADLRADAEIVVPPELFDTPDIL